MTQDSTNTLNDLYSVIASLRAGYVYIQQHPNYGAVGTDDGELLCDIGQILTDSADRLRAIMEEPS